MASTDEEGDIIHTMNGVTYKANDLRYVVVNDGNGDFHHYDITHNGTVVSKVIEIPEGVVEDA